MLVNGDQLFLTRWQLQHGKTEDLKPQTNGGFRGFMFYGVYFWFVLILYADWYDWTQFTYVYSILLYILDTSILHNMYIECVYIIYICICGIIWPWLNIEVLHFDHRFGGAGKQQMSHHTEDGNHLGKYVVWLASKCLGRFVGSPSSTS